MNILERSFILSEKICKHDIARSLKEDYYIDEEINFNFFWKKKFYIKLMK